MYCFATQAATVSQETHSHTFSPPHTNLFAGRCIRTTLGCPKEPMRDMRREIITQKQTGGGGLDGYPHDAQPYGATRWSSPMANTMEQHAKHSPRDGSCSKRWRHHFCCTTASTSTATATVCVLVTGHLRPPLNSWNTPTSQASLDALRKIAHPAVPCPNPGPCNSE